MHTHLKSDIVCDCYNAMQQCYISKHFTFTIQYQLILWQIYGVQKYIGNISALAVQQSIEKVPSSTLYSLAWSLAAAQWADASER